MSSTNYSAPCIVPAPPPPLPMHGIGLNYRLSSPLKPAKAPTNECKWAVAHPEIQRSCQLAHCCTVIAPKFLRIKSGVQAIIQEGPTCGLVALSMLVGGLPSISDLLAAARNKQYTNHGEMFSARNMLELIQSVFEAIGKSYVDVRLHSGALNSQVIKEALRSGSCVMVAYPFSSKSFDPSRSPIEVIQ